MCIYVFQTFLCLFLKFLKVGSCYCVFKNSYLTKIFYSFLPSVFYDIKLKLHSNIKRFYKTQIIYKLKMTDIIQVLNETYFVVSLLYCFASVLMSDLFFVELLFCFKF